MVASGDCWRSLLAGRFLYWGLGQAWLWLLAFLITLLEVGLLSCCAPLEMLSNRCCLVPAGKPVCCQSGSKPKLCEGGHRNESHPGTHHKALALVQRGACFGTLTPAVSSETSLAGV